MSDKRLIDGDKLLEWFRELEGNTWHISTNDVLSIMEMEVDKGRFDIPSNQGESARLRSAITSLPDKIMDVSWMDTEELNFPVENPTVEDQEEWLNTFIGLLDQHVRGLFLDEFEALSSHTEDTGIQKVRDLWDAEHLGKNQVALISAYRGGLLDACKVLGIDTAGITDRSVSDE